MRLIQIDEHDTVELWPGRKLFMTGPNGTSIIALPRTCMVLTLHPKNGFVHFGPSGRSTVQVTGSRAKGRLEALAAAIVEAERPDTSVALP